LATLLRTRRERQHGRRAAEQGDELATPHGFLSTGQRRILPHHSAEKADVHRSKK
jgi:hypothetical protein